MSHLKLIKGADKALKNLSKNYSLAIASGMMRPTMDRLLKNFSINLFTKIVTNEDVQREEDLKPAPYMINKILDELSIKKEDTIMVGDAANDVILAKNAGVNPVVVLTGHLTKDEAKELGVKYIFPDITHLPNLLSNII